MRLRARSALTKLVRCCTCTRTTSGRAASLAHTSTGRQQTTLCSCHYVATFSNSYNYSLCVSADLPCGFSRSFQRCLLAHMPLHSDTPIETESGTRERRAKLSSSAAAAAAAEIGQRCQGAIFVPRFTLAQIECCLILINDTAGKRLIGADCSRM